MSTVSPYYNLERSRTSVSSGKHRQIIGGMWDEIGRLQFDYLVAQGLGKTDRLLDMGCGCLRGGVHFVDYLEAGHYYGTDLSADLLQAGREIELRNLGLEHKLPAENLLAAGEFDGAAFGVTFDKILALSVFTHLTWNHLRLCLARLAPSVHSDTRFFATFFIVPDVTVWSGDAAHEPGGVVTHPDRDPYHYVGSDLEAACVGTGWYLAALGGWNHPRDQWMAEFRRGESAAG